MKKLALALVISAASSAAHADISTGFYLGAGVGYGHSQSKGSTVDSNPPTSTLTYDAGRDRPSVSVYTGYGMVTGCLYFGGELGYTYTNQDFRTRHAIPVAPAIYNIEFERKHVFNAALRAGYKFSPSTMGYVVAGMNYGKLKLTQSFDNGAITNVRSSKHRLTFVPGLGLETSLQKNVLLRLEFTHDFGRKASVTDATNAVTTKLKRVHSQNFKLGIAYKF